MKRVVIFNRRCIRHPEAGGAEFYTLEIAEELIKKGFEVIWVSSRAKNLKEKEIINGIKFVRKGNEFTTHFWGLLYAIKNKNAIKIDEFNGIGFFTFIFRNSLLLVHQLYEEFWDIQFGKFLGCVLRVVEKSFLKLYKKKITITVSQSTKEDLIKLGFNEKNIVIIKNKLEIKPLSSLPLKEKNFTLIYVGRLKKTKNPEDAIKSFLLIQKVVRDAKLWIIGDGPEKNYLENKYKNLKNIIFFGFVSKTKKYELLKKAHFLIAPFIHEGWGRVVLEANAMGTPAIGYNIKGLKDSIQDKETGFLVLNYKEIAEICINLWNNIEKYREISQKALNYSKNYYQNFNLEYYVSKVFKKFKSTMLNE